MRHSGPAGAATRLYPPSQGGTWIADTIGMFVSTQALPGRARRRLVVAIMVLVATVAGGATAAEAAPKGPPRLHLDHDDPGVARDVKRLRVLGTQALHDEEVLFELERRWYSQQRRYNGGMKLGGGILTGVGGLFWSLLTPTQFAGWNHSRLHPSDEALDLDGFFMIILGPPTAAMLIVGDPLLVAGIVRNHLTEHPADAPRLRRVGAGLGWSGLGVLTVGLFLTFFIPDNTDNAVPLGVLVGTNVSLIGLVLGLSGAAVWAEARRCQVLREDHGFRDQLPWRRAVDRETRARQQATRRTGLPPAHIWSYALRF